MIIQRLFLPSVPLLIALFAASTGLAENRVAVTIKPIHSLVAGVMEGVGRPSLIIKGAASPHDFALKPSQAAELENANLIFWVGPGLETSLEKPINTLGSKARVAPLAETVGLKKLAPRDDAAFDAHEHEHHGTDGHDEHHGTTHHEEHHSTGSHDEHHKEHQDRHGAHHGGFDLHVWLDPENAKVMTLAIARVLSESDPENAARYQTNALALAHALDTLSRELADTLKPAQNKPFIVFHDAYQYFENRFGLTSAGSITLSPEVLPGAERIAEIQEKIQRAGVSCVFAEPQFPSKLIAVVSEGANAKIAVLDPLGADLEDGPELYFSVMRTMAKSVRDCLLSGA